MDGTRDSHTELSEVSQKEKDKYHMMSLISEISCKAQRNLSTEKKIMDMEKRLWLPRGRRGGGGSGMDGVLGVNRWRLWPLEWISSEILLCSTGNYVWSLMMEHDSVKKGTYTCRCNWITML